MSSRLLQSILLASELLNAYTYVATGELCGCAATGSDLSAFGKCLSDAVAGGKCENPDYNAVVSSFAPTEVCDSESGKLLLINPKVAMQLVTEFQLNGMDVPPAADCSVSSVQIGDVAADGVISDGKKLATCSAFVKKQDVKVVPAKPSPAGVMTLKFEEPMDSMLGNAILVEAPGCIFAFAETAKVHYAYNGAEKLFAGAAAFIALMAVAQTL